MKIIKGDILNDINNDNLTIIIHGCNCHHVMGAGIAKYLRNKYPEVFQADMTTPLSDASKLGTFSMAKISNSLIILNCYTQFHYDSRYRQLDYEALYQCLERISEMTSVKTLKKVEVRSPKIGCGLAGGDWSIVEKMFEKLLPNAIIYEL